MHQQNQSNPTATKDHLVAVWAVLRVVVVEWDVVVEEEGEKSFKNCHPW